MKTCFAVAFLLLLFSVQYVSARPGQFTQKSNLSFIANAGQITDQHDNPRKDIDYKLNAPGMDIFVGDGQIHYQWSKSLSVSADKTMMKETRLEGTKVEIYRMDVELVGANKNAKVIAEEPQAFYERYYTTETGEEGLVAHSFNKITYKDIYPNIDWVLYTRDNQLKYDFVVRPGGNVADIQIKYKGATSLNITDGALMAVTPFGSITEQKPYSYEATTGKEITSRYELKDNILSFEAGICNSTLIIDPTLQWGTYYGGSQDDAACDVATDLAGYIYTCGVTNSNNNIVTSGAFQTTISTLFTAFLAKFNNAGQRLWSTYYNGSLYSVTCDPNGMIYAGGRVTSAAVNVITPGSHQPAYAGGNDDGLLVKFDGAGQRVWGSYYGGSQGESISRLATDPFGYIYIAGIVQNSSNGIATAGSHQPTFGGGGEDNFIAKFNSAGQRLWGSYYGGASGEFQPPSLATDPFGNVYLSGISTYNVLTPNVMASPNGYKYNYTLGGFEAYLAKFNGNGQRLWGTYYGGSAGEYDNKVAVDGSGNPYLMGYTHSDTGIATPGAYQPLLIGAGNAYIVKFNTSGQRLWGTYYGGSTTSCFLNDAIFDIGRNIYFSGTVDNAAGFTTPGAYQTIHGGATDNFIAKFSGSGQMLWATFYGGAGSEDFSTPIGGIAADSTGSIYIAGVTNSTNAISTAASHQPGYGGGASDGFLAKFRNEDTLVYIKALLTDTLLCPLDTIRVPYGLTYNFRSNNTFTLQLSDATGSFISPVTIGMVAANAAGWINGVIPVTAAAGTDYRVRIVASAPADTSLWRSIHIKPRPAAPSAGSNTPVCSGQAINLNALTGAAGASYHWTGPASYSSNVQSPTRANATTAMGGVYNVTVTVDGCTSAATPTTVVVNPGPAAPVAGSNSPICAGTSLNLTASLVPGVSYSWNGPGAFTSNQQNPVITPAATSAAGTYTVNVTDGNGCVSANATTTVVINNSNAPTVGVFPNPNDSVCPGAMVTFIAVPNNGGTPTYQWYKNTLQIPGATNATYMTNTVSTGDFYSVAMTSTAVCAVPATVNSNNVIMTVVPPVVPSVTISASPGLNVGPWRMITFTATPVNGGSSPTYQWLRNGQPVIGAVSNTWGANNLSDNDAISVVLFSSEVCAIPSTDTSNTQLVHINLGILDHSNNTANIQLYPNPNNGDFVIKGDLSEAVSIEVVNAIGQTVYPRQSRDQRSWQLTVGSQQSFAYPIHLDVASGVYLLKVASDKGVETVRFRVE